MYFFQIESVVYGYRSSNLGIDLDKGKGIKYLTFMASSIYYSIKLLTPKDPGVFLVKTASNQPLLKRRRSVQKWIIF
jgi:hypothetical protein